MNSRIIPATVAHKRLAPKNHAFAYSYLCLLLDLDELEELDRSSRFFGLDRPRPIALQCTDYLTTGPEPIKTKLLALLAANHLELPDTNCRILLLTAARVFGQVFNPVSFYFCFNSRGQLELCVAEVNNTFGDKHVYLLGRPDNPEGFPVTYHAAKSFHVSPFFDMDGEYIFRFDDIQKNLDIAVTLHKQGRPMLEATLRQRAPARELTDKALLGAWVRHPLAPNLTYLRILRQALALYLQKGLSVFSRPEPADPMTIRTMPRRSSWIDTIVQHLVFWNFDKIQNGTLNIHLPDGGRRVFGGKAPGPTCEMRITDQRFFRSLLKGEDVALGEAYTQGFWTTADLPRLMELLIMNMGRMAYLEDLGAAGRLLHRCLVLARRTIPDNSHAGSRANIQAHYDLSNDFFRLFLDPTMTYSCGVFDDLPERLRSPAPISSRELRQAQERKFRMIIESLDLPLGAQILEIGCGWGGFACYLAENSSCRITASTISQKQYDHVQELVRNRGLDSRINVLLEDYRNLHGQFDAIVSIEMLEAVGHAYHPLYFQAVDRLLKPGGKACIQTITILDQRYDTYRQTQDWISTHIFPGGKLPSLNRITQVLARHSSLVVADVRDIGLHYALTLKTWRERFTASWDRIAALGFDQTFRRTWEYYFAMCEAAFTQRHIRDLQIVLDRPRYFE